MDLEELRRKITVGILELTTFNSMWEISDVIEIIDKCFDECEENEWKDN